METFAIIVGVVLSLDAAILGWWMTGREKASEQEHRFNSAVQYRDLNNITTVNDPMLIVAGDEGTFTYQPSNNCHKSNYINLEGVVAKVGKHALWIKTKTEIVEVQNWQLICGHFA